MHQCLFFMKDDLIDARQVVKHGCYHKVTRIQIENRVS